MNTDRFKFRAWNIEEKKYYWDVDNTFDGEMSGSDTPITTTIGMDHSSFASVVADPGYIVEQCTGLKDCNGNLIYEGDVLRLAIPYSNTFIVQCVFDMIYSYDVNSPGFELIDIDGSNAAHSFDPEWLEVIGNIHEAENIELSYEEIDFCPVKKDCADLNCYRNTPYRRSIELPVWVANIKWNCKKYKKETEK